MSKPEEVTISPVQFEVIEEGAITLLTVRHSGWPAEQPAMLCMSVASDLIASPPAGIAFRTLVEEIAKHIHRTTFGEEVVMDGLIHIDARNPH